MRLNKGVFALAAAGALALAGCSAGTDGGAEADGGHPASNINPKDVSELADGGTMRLAIAADVEQWNRPHVNGNTGDVRDLMDHLLPQNFIISDAAVATPNPNFVESAEAMEKDGKTVVTLKLNPKAVWNDGTPITVADYVATWKSCNGENTAFECASTDGLSQTESVEKGADEFEVVWTFAGPYPDWTAVLSIVYHRDSAANPEVFNTAQISEPNQKWLTGPYAFTKIDKATKTYEYGRNPNWWGTPAKLDSIVIGVVPAEGQANSFANKELDVAQAIDSSQYETLAKRADAELRGALSPQWRHFTFNSTAGLMKDVELRRAIVKGINRAAIAESDLAGLPVKPETLMLGNHFFMPGQEGYQDNSGDYNYNPEKAKEELEALGWKPGADGIREKDGQRLTIKYAMLTGIFTSENEGKLLQAQLKDIGVEVELVPSDPGNFGTMLSSGSFEITAFTWVGTPYPMNNVGQIYGSNSASNYAKINDPKVDEYVEKIAVETDRAERIKLTNEVDKLIWDNVHTLPIYNRVLFVGVPKNLANYGSFGISSVDVATWGYLPEAK
ncbi:MAG: ABC transporter family substrate-binding protein [Buchananella hordeovulneris]|nr:ABC transporter family substrate-binding protein [Buchananella hordeovulneris]